MAQTEKEMNADGHLNKLMETSSVEGYVIFNHDGIPMRYDNKIINHKKAVHISSLFSEYFRVCKKIMNEDLKNFTLTGNAPINKNNLYNENEIELIRMRTTNAREFILTYHGEFFMVCVQKFINDLENDDLSETGSQLDSNEHRF